MDSRASTPETGHLENYGWRLKHCTGVATKTIPKKKRCKKAKWLSEEAL